MYGTIEATESRLEGVRFEATESLLVPRRKWRTERRSGSQVDEGDAASGSAHDIREGSEEGVGAGNGQGPIMRLGEILSIIVPIVIAITLGRRCPRSISTVNLSLGFLMKHLPKKSLPFSDSSSWISGNSSSEPMWRRSGPPSITIAITLSLDSPALALHDNALSLRSPALASPRHGKALALSLPRPALAPCRTASPFLPPSLPPFPESGKVPEEDAPTLTLTSPSPQPPATLSQSMEGISLLQLLHCSEMVSTAAFRIEMGMSSSCPFCNLNVPLANLEWYFFSLLCFPKFDPIFGWCSDKMDVMIKKKVEDAMPIATGLEREELKVKLEIHLDKMVPTHSGLCVGSSNAATALWAANQFNGFLATEKELQEWSGKIGSNIPFFFSHGPAYCTGRVRSRCRCLVDFVCMAAACRSLGGQLTSALGRRRSPRSRSGRGDGARRDPNRCVIFKNPNRTEQGKLCSARGRLLCRFLGRFGLLKVRGVCSRLEDIAWSGGDAVLSSVFVFFVKVGLFIALETVNTMLGYPLKHAKRELSMV
ncbi:hypothetical protein Taro_031402 [Colocasia esculenta]|uniref:GHMP kinase N-terminal domain-containing protein n=1 Tax=Colocasia esculenta TaxID=4460 RepID=A0A843VPX7_COLES|nr:hypothetical protein [Colocasia esculenta]